MVEGRDGCRGRGRLHRRQGFGYEMDIYASTNTLSGKDIGWSLYIYVHYRIQWSIRHTRYHQISFPQNTIYPRYRAIQPPDQDQHHRQQVPSIETNCLQEPQGYHRRLPHLLDPPPRAIERPPEPPAKPITTSNPSTRINPH